VAQLTLFGGAKKKRKKPRPRAKPAASWAAFTKKNMSAFMKSYGSHAAAMRALGVAWRKQKPAKKKPAKKRATKKKPAKRCKAPVRVKGYTRRCPRRG